MTKRKHTTTRKPKAKSKAPAKATAKAAKTATAKPAADSRPGAGKPARDGDKKITLKTPVKDNPYKGKRGAGYALLHDGMLVSDFYTAGHAAGFASSLLRSVLIVGAAGKHLVLNGKK